MNDSAQSHEEAKADTACTKRGHTLFTTRPGCQTCVKQETLRVKQETLRVKRNTAARARNQAMRDLGLTRTRSGSWE